MERNDFFTKIEKAVAEFMPEANVSVTEVMKNNGLLLHGLVINRKESKVSPTIYLEQFYEQYEDGTPFGEIVRNIEETMREHERDDVNMDYFRDFEKVKDRIVYKIVNYEMNVELLESVPYVKWNDLAIVFCHVCDECMLGYATILIRNCHLDMWGIDNEQLFEYARINTPRLMQDEMTSMDEVLKDIMERNQCFMPLPEQGVDAAVGNMYVLTNAKRIFGATSMLYSRRLEELSDRFGTGLYILPSSIHEVIILPESDTCDVEYIRDMISEVNETQVSLEERLSDNLYYYDRDRREIRIAV